MGLYRLFLKFGGVYLLLLTILFACQIKQEQLKSPPGYDFSNRPKKVLDTDLFEISGIAWDHNKNHFAAIRDEDGTLFILDREHQDVTKEYKVIGKGDFEDVAFVNSVPYLMKSDGTIYKYSIDSSGEKASETEMGTLDLKGGADFESMYYDPGRRSLILLCKNCEIDDKKKVSAFAFNLDSNAFNTTPVYQIDVAAVEKLAPKKSTRLEPSAAAIHPVQQKLYIVSSGSRQLAIADLNGNVESVFVLAANYFPQPEGICFKQSGDMFITNEGVLGAASL